MTEQAAMRPALITVDWGTSAWRAALWSQDGRLVEERQAPRGILEIPQGSFAQAWRELCGSWLESGATLCLMSGMIGSRQGWQEVPYLACPVTFDALASRVDFIEDATLPMRVGIAPGLQCEHDGLPDVMRGEEVQILGAAALLGRTQGHFVLPGTHSKWATMHDGAITGFRSYMTGEIYALLRQQSILSRLMPPVEQDRLDEAAFLQGVRASRDGSLLSQIFSARTLGLMGRMSAQALPSYLSGLLIGAEVSSQALTQGGSEPIILVGAAGLVARYRLAAHEFALHCLEPSHSAAWAGLTRLAWACQ